MPLISRRDILQRLVFLLLVGTSGTVFAQQEQQAYDRLKDVDRFAFGGVGYAGSISKGELDFRILMHQMKLQTRTQLDKLYADGNPQAKAYALAGLHLMSPDRFNELRATLPDGEVQIERGCIINKESLASIAKEIASGEFDTLIERDQ